MSWKSGGSKFTASLMVQFEIYTIFLVTYPSPHIMRKAGETR